MSLKKKALKDDKMGKMLIKWVRTELHTHIQALATGRNLRNRKKPTFAKSNFKDMFIPSSDNQGEQGMVGNLSSASDSPNVCRSQDWARV